MKLIVNQGHSVESGGVWYNQGDFFTTPDGTKFEKGSVTIVSEPQPEQKKNKKEEG